ncbi:MAG: ABC transporter ATP-binding protein, partial [Phaeodactylibacter sp.]|nr:ABC transporter ATP-binding protein [Phaeodactylibacter sp.]
AILFITHDLGVIAEIADEVLEMYRGEMVEYGPVLEIFAQPRHPYTKGLLACRPPLDHQPDRLPVLRDFLEPAEEQRPTKVIARPPITDQAILQLSHLSVSYAARGSNFWNKKSKVRAVDQVDLAIFEGESLGLVGESGSGKTTLGKALLRLVPSEEGRLLFDNRDLFQLPDKDWRRLQPNFQMIFQDPYASLNPRKPIGEALIEPMQVHGLYGNRRQQEEKAVEVLELVRLEADHLRRLPKAFSGGQRQRICIARALALAPRFLICDECVSALDVSIQAEILNLLADLRDQFQLTLLFISHDLSVVRFLCDRIAVMRAGKIVEIGTGEAILDQPRSAYTRQLIDAIPKGL